MRSRRRNMILAAAVVAAVALVAGIASVAGAGSSKALPSVSAAELLAKMAQSDTRPQSVSGEISWNNGLFGDLDILPGFVQAPAQSPLLSSGSGRLWASAAGDAPSPLPSATATLTPAAVSAYLQRLAPYATAEVAGQATVAGREAYLLRMTPVAEDTALGAVQASIDGETMVPLRFEVFAKSGGEAVLRFGFDSISYEAVDAALYEFAAPDGAKVTTEEIDPSKMLDGAGEEARQGADVGREPAEVEKAARGALLTLDQAQSLIDYKLARAREYDARPFRWACVFGAGGPLTPAGKPLFEMAGIDEPSTLGPGTVLLYGSGFGAIALVQMKTTPELGEQLEQLPALVGTTTVNGVPVRSLITPLGGVFIWQQDGTTLAAGGLVTEADLEAFVRFVR